ncbi:hypothetical protein N9D31_00695 [Oligoflexaceae bacterium]|nr:hypothetical protein [Oligoflexaceae bacterium]
MKILLASLMIMVIGSSAAALEQGEYKMELEQSTSDLRIDVVLGETTGCEPVYIDLDVSVPKFIEWNKETVIPVKMSENLFHKGYRYVLDRLQSKLSVEDYKKVQRAMTNFSNILPPPTTCAAQMPIYGTAYIPAKSLKTGPVKFTFPKNWPTFKVIELDQIK